MRKMKKILMTMMLLSVTVSLVAACGNKPKAADVTATADGQVTEEVSEAAADLAPDFELPALQGNTLKLSSLRGKYVVLDFWGSWCVWCIRGIPAMKEAYAKYKDKMEILGVDCRDTEEKWKAAVEQHELPWLQVRCDDEAMQKIGQLYNLEGFPTKVVIDPEGKLLKVVVGEDPQFYTFLDELFAE
jgi:thiol-disulfide isomerase/thioredoxin